MIKETEEIEQTKNATSRYIIIIIFAIILISSAMFLFDLRIGEVSNKSYYVKGRQCGEKIISDALSAEIDLRKVPLKGEALFEMRVRAPYKHGKRGDLYLVPGTTKLVPENQIEGGGKR